MSHDPYTARTKSTRRVLTYGTFDLLHLGHLRLLERARRIGDELIVGLSTDDFNKKKGKQAHQCYDERRRNVLSTGIVKHVIPEENWEQKKNDIVQFDIQIFCMGSDWEGKFDYLKETCDVIYFPRTAGIDSSTIRMHIENGDTASIEKLIHDGLISNHLKQKIKNKI